MNRDHIQELAEQQAAKRQALFTSVKVDETHFEVGGHPYEIVNEYRDGFDLEKFTERYSTILSKYDYVVGDWEFDQLRLKGFYRNELRDANPSQQISALQDYLYEYCNFGCAYFVLHNERVVTPKRPQRSRRSEHHNKQRNNNSNNQRPRRQNNNRRKRGAEKHFTTRKKAAPFSEKQVKAVKVQPKNGQQVQTSQHSGKRHFTIRQK